MANPSEDFQYVRAEDLFKSAQPTTIAQDVRAEIRRQNGDAVLDQEQLRRQEDWSAMANRVVGAEGI